METRKMWIVLRWIGLAPATFLAWTAAWNISWRLARFSEQMVLTEKIEEGDFMDNLNKLGGIIIATIFAKCFAEIMAPSHKEKAGVFTCVAFLVLGLVTITIGLLYPHSTDWGFIFQTTAMIVTAIVLLSQNLTVKKKDDEY